MTIVDDKKNETTGIDASGNKVNAINFKGFVISYILSLLVIIFFLIFIIGSLGLFTTKVAQANILPDNINSYPYTDLTSNISSKNKTIDINIIRPTIFAEYNEILSQKIQFNKNDYLNTFTNEHSIFNMLKQGKNADNPSILSNVTLYFVTVIEHTLAINYKFMNTIFRGFANLPEWLIMILYAFCGIFIWILLYFTTYM